MTRLDLTRRSLLASTMAGALLAGLPAAAFAQASAPVHGGTVVLVVNPEPAALVPIANNDAGTVSVSGKVVEGLLSYDLDFNPIPQLAIGWSVSDDDREYTFVLRQGVKWHDGRDFTSADVARSFALLKAVHERGKTTFRNLVEVRTPDPHTAVAMFSEPAPFLLRALAAFETPIFPAHLYPDDDVQANDNRFAPIGTGPFRFVSWERGSHIVLERNEDYWDSPRPYLDRIVVRFISDPAARAIALETGDVDIAGTAPVPNGDIARLVALPHLDVTTQGYGYIPQPIQVQFNLENPYLADLRVRQAFAHAIDRDFIVRNILSGYGRPIHSALSPSNAPFYTDEVTTYPFDLERAEALLDEAGFARGPDGLRFTVTYDYPSHRPERKPIAEYIQSNLATIGVRVVLRPGDAAAVARRVNTDREFDLVAAQFAQMFDPSIGVPRVYVTPSAPAGTYTNNPGNYSNPRVDELLALAGVESDVAKRVAYFHEVQRIVADEIPVINLIDIENVTLFNKRVQGHSETIDGLRSNWANVHVVD